MKLTRDAANNCILGMLMGETIVSFLAFIYFWYLGTQEQYPQFQEYCYMGELFFAGMFVFFTMYSIIRFFDTVAILEDE